MAYLELKNVIKEYKSEAGSFRALNNVSFTLENGEFVVIVGPSGAGKTTLLNLLGGMDDITAGHVILDNEDISTYSQKALVRHRRNNVGFVFQFYNLMANLNAIENVKLATEVTKSILNPSEILKSVGLEARAVHRPAQLSGGEQQRVSIARAIAKDPKILLCDEPTGALDYETGKRVLKLLYDISKTQKKLVIVVTHNQAIKEMANHVIEIKNGEIIKNYFNKKPKSVEEIAW